MGVKYLCFLLALLLVCCESARSDPAVQEGDLIFQESSSSQSAAIQKATRSRYSHMGIIFFRDGKPFVFEAARTVQFTPLTEWVKRGVREHFILKRLKQKLERSQVEQLKAASQEFLNRPYDLLFGWSDEKIYCSELVWKIYKRALNMEVGTLSKLRDFDLTSPIVKSKMRERYGDTPPLDEVVISPAAMFDSTLLESIRED